MRVFAFEGIRYTGRDEDPGVLVAPPYDQINDALRDRLHAVSPHQFAHLIKPLPGRTGSPYREAARLHGTWLEDGTLAVEDRPSLYPYEIVLAHSGTRLGLTALVGLEEPETGVIRPHEQTLDKPLADRLELLRTTAVDLEPALLLPDDGGALDTMLAEDIRGRKPLVEHTDADGHRHRLYRVSDAARIARYQALLAPLSAAIADGHHRYKTGLLHAREIAAPPGTAAAAKLAVITSLAAPSLTIDPIHRALAGERDLAPLHALVADRRPSTARTGEELAAEVARAPQPALGVWQHGREPEIWRLDPAAAPASRTPSARALTVVLLAEALFPALGLGAAASTDGTVIYRSDPRELHRMVAAGEVGTGFFMPPMTPAEFGAAIANGDLLPPKSTRFLPKVFSGLVWAPHTARLS